jgi:CRISPR/Cas system CSM-associated protein Csm3 (group 7 of RAMP superfamily)
MQKIKQRELGVEHAVFQPSTHDKRLLRNFSSMQNLIQEKKKLEEYNNERKKVKQLFNSNPFMSHKLIIKAQNSDDDDDLEQTKEEEEAPIWIPGHGKKAASPRQSEYITNPILS